MNPKKQKKLNAFKNNPKKIKNLNKSKKTPNKSKEIQNKNKQSKAINDKQIHNISWETA